MMCRKNLYRSLCMFNPNLLVIKSELLSGRGAFAQVTLMTGDELSTTVTEVV